MSRPTSWRLERYPELASTNTHLLERAREGCAEGLAVLAGRQSAGRGRGGRRWCSPPGNLHLSVLLRPPLPLARCASLALVAGLAARDGLLRFAPDLSVRLKWPNDLMLGDAKLGGLLLEAAGADRGEEGLVLGLGVNLSRAPADLDRPAAALADMGLALPPEPAAEAFLDNLFLRYRRWLEEGFRGQREEWLRASVGVGARVAFRTGAETVAGTMVGVDEEGALLLEADGRLRRFLAGELFFARRPLSPAGLRAPTGGA